MSSPDLTMLVPQLQKVCAQLEQFAQRTVSHRRKFQFACNQFRQFVDSFEKSAAKVPVTQTQIDSFREIVEVQKRYFQLFSQNLECCWVSFCLENRSKTVAAELCGLATHLRAVTAPLDQRASLAFDATAQEWLQFHCLDLRAMAPSFQKFLDSAGSANQVDAAAVEKIEARLNSMNVFLKQYDPEFIKSSDKAVSPIPIHYQSWRLNHDDLEQIREVGSGVSAVVFYGKDKRTGEEVAIKRLKFKKLNGAKLMAFQRELAILATAEHPCLLHFVGATDTPPFCIVTEWMPGESLYHDLHKRHRLDETMRTIAAYDIARGMAFLHSRQIMHRDLKSLNVLLDKDGRTRICDFGFSRKAEKAQVMTMNVGTPHWMAPELLTSSNGYDNKIDVYAYAIVVWELMTSQLPYQGLDPTQIIAQVLMNDLRPQIPPSTPQPVREMVERCWDRDPERRPTFDEIVRAFQTGCIMLEGANEEMVREYLESTTDQAEDSLAEPEEDEPKKNNEEASQSPVGFAEIVSSLEKNGVPQDGDDQCWQRLEGLEKQDQVMYARAMVKFLSSTYSDKAASSLRQMPVDSIPDYVVNDIISAIPTGREDIDSELVMAACKNGAADAVALRVIQMDDLKIALEVAAEQGVAADRKDALVQKCLHCMTKPDQMLNAAAFRCLIGIDQTSSIPMNTLKLFIQSKNDTLRMAAQMAAAKMALEGVSLPIDVIDALITKINSEPLAGHVLVSACQSRDIASHLVNRLVYGVLMNPDVCLRILKQASQHQNLVPNITAILERAITSSLPENLNRKYQALLGLLQRGP